MAKCSSSITITIVNDGEAGNGISSITYTYATSTTQTVPSTVNKTTIPTLSSTNKYLWQKEVIAYTDGTNKTTTALIAVYGDKGDTGSKGDKGDTGATGATGATGNGISSIKYYYAATTTQSAPSSVTGTTIPTLSSTNKYLWQKEVISYTDGTNKTTTALIGVYGDKGDTGAKGDKGDTGATGATGATGNGISSIKYYYATSTTQTAPSSVTGTTIPTLSSTNKYLWQKEVIAYTDGTDKTTTALIGVYGDKGDTGAKGDKGDTGATGATGSKGDKGDKGDTGATGATGPQGEKGDKGDTGATGATGPQGPQGNKGDAAWSYVTLTSGYNLNSCFTKDTIYVSTSTAICNSLLNKPSGFVAGEVRVEVQWCGSDSYVIQKLYCKSGSTTKSFYRAKSGSTVGDWVEMGTKGDKGDTGATGPQGPQGEKGDTGATGATGATGPQGPQGEKGDKGDTGSTGPQGPQGEKGETGSSGTSVSISSTSVTYQASSSGTTAPTGEWKTTVPTVSKGQYLWTRTIVNYSPSGSTTSYAVAYIGTNGSNGTSYYTHIRYSASSDGSNMSTTPNSYMGIYTGTSSSAPTSAASYSWSKIKGDTGADGNAIASVSMAYGVTDLADSVPTTWVDDEADVTWDEGQWLWTRRTVSYTETTDQDVEFTRQFKPVTIRQWDFSLNVETRSFDLRNATHSVDLILTPHIIGYSVTPTVTYNGSAVSMTDEGSYKVTVLDSDTNDGVFRMYATSLDVSKTVKAVDITSYVQKFPASSTAPTNAIVGDFYYDLSELKPKQKTASGWEESSNHTVLLATLDDAFATKERVTAEVYARYGYFKNIVAKYIDVEELFADEITVKGSIESDNYVADSSGFRIDGGTGEAEFIGAKMTNCTITGNLTANDVQSAALKTVNADVAGSAVSSSDMLNKSAPYYLLSDALASVKAQFTSNSKANQLVDFSASNSSFQFAGTSYAKAMYVTANGTEIALKSNQSLSWPTITDRSDIVLGSFSVVVPIVSVLKITGTLAQRYYKTNSRESYTYYTDYAYWDHPSSRTGVVYVDNMNDGYSSQSQPANPQDGTTYTTYDSVSASNYEYEAEVVSRSNTKPSTSWNYYTTSDGIRHRRKATDVVKGDDGWYDYTTLYEAASTYWQSYYVHTYYEGTNSNTGYRPTADNVTGGTQTAKWQYSLDNSTWTSLSGATVTVNISNPNQTVYIRQVISKPTATYYLVNGYDTTTTTSPWGAAKTNGVASTVTYDLSKFANGQVYAFNAANVMSKQFTYTASDNPINSTFLVKLAGTTWFTKDASDSTWLNKQYYKVKATPFTTEVSTSSFTELSVSYVVFEGSSGAVSHSVTSGSEVVFSNSTNNVAVNGVVYIDKNHFYRSASAMVTPNSKSKGVYVLGVQPQGTGIDIGSSTVPFDDVFANKFNGPSTSCTGNSATATRAVGAGDGGIVMKANNSNEVNFGGSNTSTDIYFGYRATDSRPVPTIYHFGATDNATIKAGHVYGAVFN